MVFIENQFETAINSPSNKQRNDMRDLLDEKFGQQYRGLYDRVSILSHVCDEVFGDPRCKMPEDLNKSHIDQRSTTFHEEFQVEINNALKDEVQIIKSYKKQRWGSETGKDDL